MFPHAPPSHHNYPSFPPAAPPPHIQPYTIARYVNSLGGEVWRYEPVSCPIEPPRGPHRSGHGSGKDYYPSHPPSPSPQASGYCHPPLSPLSAARPSPSQARARGHSPRPASNSYTRKRYDNTNSQFPPFCPESSRGPGSSPGRISPPFGRARRASYSHGPAPGAAPSEGRAFQNQRFGLENGLSFQLDTKSNSFVNGSEVTLTGPGRILMFKGEKVGQIPGKAPIPCFLDARFEMFSWFPECAATPTLSQMSGTGLKDYSGTLAPCVCVLIPNLPRTRQYSEAIEKAYASDTEWVIPSHLNLGVTDPITLLSDNYDSALYNKVAPLCAYVLASWGQY
ncbi:hypothetical protein DFP72DRAFT_1117749 [Ephemerocybe angulata]|uniref:Uncharacterized protein n=1 Tax=Ephemerocybe angulata TaxID=980116 RepID=A0A8H6I2I4_9AGAR|nr:hypothetical protein DFP72DRAFT_1117749 [Tulosesus angulatus]